jgi:LysR family transcriptional regulator, benzoate and cis,cis-muconate-responsive activator of ben and cat genes
LNLRQLRYFCEVVDAGSARAAASKLFVAPTAISMQLAQLEDALGGPLLDRTSRPMSLTPLGEFVYPKARELLSAATRLEREARGMAAGKLGWLGIGFTRSVIFSILPEAVRFMQAEFPEVRIDLLEILTEDQPASLRSGAIHLGVARVIGDFTMEPDLLYSELLDDPLVAAVPIQHALSTKNAVTACELEGLPYITYPGNAGSQFSRQVLSLLAAAGSKPRIGHEAKEIHTALSLVAAGLGATVVGRSVAINNRTDIKFLPITDVEVHSRVIAVRKADSDHGLSASFLEILRKQIRKSTLTG